MLYSRVLLWLFPSFTYENISFFSFILSSLFFFGKIYTPCVLRWCLILSECQPSKRLFLITKFWMKKINIIKKTGLDRSRQSWPDRNRITDNFIQLYLVGPEPDIWSTYTKIDICLPPGRRLRSRRWSGSTTAGTKSWISGIRSLSILTAHAYLKEEFFFCAVSLTVHIKELAGFFVLSPKSKVSSL